MYFDITLALPAGLCGRDGEYASAAWCGGHVRGTRDRPTPTRGHRADINAHAGASGRSLRRVGVLLVCVAVAALSVSGCAAAARVLTVVEAASALHDILASIPASRPSVSGTPMVHAMVSGTGGAGLRLERRPGSGRLSVWPEGSLVTVHCQAAGPQVAGPLGPRSTWSQVITADGSRGFMSDAYLTIDADPSAVPPC